MQRPGIRFEKKFYLTEHSSKKIVWYHERVDMESISIFLLNFQREGGGSYSHLKIYYLERPMKPSVSFWHMGSLEPFI
jgi:hypothetical protein